MRETINQFIFIAKDNLLKLASEKWKVEKEFGHDSYKEFFWRGGRGNTLVTAYTCPKMIVNYPYEGRVSSEFWNRELVRLFNTAVHSSQKIKDKFFKALNQNKRNIKQKRINIQD